MKFKKYEYRCNFAIMPNYCLHDKNLTPELKGIMCQLLDMDDNITLSIKLISRILGYSERTTLIKINKLIEFGYIERIQKNVNGKFMNVEYIIYPSPKSMLESCGYSECENNKNSKEDKEKKQEQRNNTNNLINEKLNISSKFVLDGENDKSKQVNAIISDIILNATEDERIDLINHISTINKDDYMKIFVGAMYNNQIYNRKSYIKKCINNYIPNKRYLINNKIDIDSFRQKLIDIYYNCVNLGGDTYKNIP